MANLKVGNKEFDKREDISDHLLGLVGCRVDGVQLSAKNRREASFTFKGRETYVLKYEDFESETPYSLFLGLVVEKVEVNKDMVMIYFTNGWYLYVKLYEDKEDD